MEVINYLVSWVVTYVRDLQATYMGVIIYLLSIMDIPVGLFVYQNTPFFKNFVGDPGDFPGSFRIQPPELIQWFHEKNRCEYKPLGSANHRASNDWGVVQHRNETHRYI